MGKILEKVHEVSYPLLQVALDLTNIEEALKLGANLSSLGVDIVEVGTPLIKAEGVRSVALLKSISRNSFILADMKTADVGGLETELVWKAGADATTVLASSDDEVIQAAVSKGEELGVDVIVDTVGLKDVESRVKEVIRLGARIINIHVGIDVQRTRGMTAADVAVKYAGLIRENPDVIFSISGGVKLGDLDRLSGLGFKIIIVGSAITKSPNPESTARTFLKHLRRSTL
ncbi:MAG: orotidine 5'-phosphate decarboxylase [Desulfurococcales archaeon]|nr:orotidine 5'-phosphate decarboxylase [Desulfurococcales archaeon]